MTKKYTPEEAGIIKTLTVQCLPSTLYITAGGETMALKMCEMNQSIANLKVGKNFQGSTIEKIDYPTDECMIFGRNFLKREMEIVNQHFLDFLTDDQKEKLNDMFPKTTKDELCSRVRWILLTIAKDLVKDVNSCEMQLKKIPTEKVVQIAKFFNIDDAENMKKSELCAKIQETAAQFINSSSDKKIQQIAQSMASIGGQDWFEKSRSAVKKYSSLDPRFQQGQAWGWIKGIAENLYGAGKAFKNAGKATGSALINTGKGALEVGKAALKVAGSPLIVPALAIADKVNSTDINKKQKNTNKKQKQGYIPPPPRVPTSYYSDKKQTYNMKPNLSPMNSKLDRVGQYVKTPKGWVEISNQPKSYNFNKPQPQLDKVGKYVQTPNGWVKVSDESKNSYNYMNKPQPKSTLTYQIQKEYQERLKRNTPSPKKRSFFSTSAESSPVKKSKRKARSPTTRSPKKKKVSKKNKISQ